jgi:hypothetical protein
MMKPIPKVIAIARPVRVVYVLEKGDGDAAWLDEVFAKSFSRDGGRNSLVVPVINGEIARKYLFWIREIDPDEIVLAVYDPNAVALVISPFVADVKMTKCERNTNSAGSKPYAGCDTSALTSLSWLPYLQATANWATPKPEFILDAYPAWIDDGLVTDNFGTLYKSYGKFPADEQIGLTSLVLTPTNPPENRWHFKHRSCEEISDSYDILRKMSVRHGIVNMSQLANMYSGFDGFNHAWVSTFCLVVGDSFEDRISCWNAGLLFGSPQGQTICTLRIPASAITNSTQIEALSVFLRERNWLGSNKGQPEITIRSHSLQSEALIDFSKQLKQSSNAIVNIAPISNLEDCCPTDVKSRHFGQMWMKLSNVEQETNIQGKDTNIGVTSPSHLQYCKGEAPIFSVGGWYLNLKIDRINDHNLYENVRDEWLLPHQRGMAKLICKAPLARIQKNRRLALQVDSNTQGVELNQPEDADIFWHLSCDNSPFPYDDPRWRDPKPPQYEYIEPSNQGRYLQGLIGMFGGLNQASNIFANHFWRTQFQNMAAPAETQRAEVIEYLKKRLQAENGRLEINDQDGWDNLAKRVIEKAAKLRVPKLTTKYERIQSDGMTEVEAAINNDLNLVSSWREILGDTPADLKSSLHHLLSCGVYHRGHEWVCRKCSHRNWIDISLVRNELLCEVCREPHSLPVDFKFDFRLNEFLATCIREHDTLSVLWALARLRMEAKTSFIFNPQTGLYLKYPENRGAKPDVEVDVMCVADGVLVLGEVKASAGAIRRPDIVKLANAVKDLDASKAVLMALSDEKSNMPKKLAELKKLLPESIDCESYVSDWGDTPSWTLHF